MIKKPLISIIIPAFNSEKTIDKIILDVLAQEYKNIELLVIDDGSKDSTLDLIKKHQKDARLKVISQHNQGVSAARNVGLQLASGEYVMFFDSDDRISKDMISGMMGAIIKNPESLIVCGFKYNGKNLLPKHSGLISKNFVKHVLVSILESGILYSPCNKIYRLDIIKNHKILFPIGVKFGEDLIFNLAYLSFNNSVFYIKKPYYIYEKSDSGSSANSASSQKDRNSMFAGLKKFVKASGQNKYPTLMQLIRLRWLVSVQKTKIIKRIKK